MAEDEPKKKSKYNSRKVAMDGHTFDSAAEASRYRQLRMMRDAGRITDLQLQVRFKIERWCSLSSRTETICTYISDFVYRKDGVQVVEDVKSKMTAKLPVYRLKKKLMRIILGIEIKETVY